MAFRPSIFSPTLFLEAVSTFAAAVRNSLRPCRTYSSSRGAARGEVPTSLSTTARERRMQRTALLRRNRRDPELERAARTGTRELSLEFSHFIKSSSSLSRSVSSPGPGPERVAGSQRTGPADESWPPFQHIPGPVRRPSVQTSRVHGGRLWREDCSQRNHSLPD